MTQSVKFVPRQTAALEGSKQSPFDLRIVTSKTERRDVFQLRLRAYREFLDADQATGLTEYLREKRVTELHILGLGTDHCIKATALDALTLGLKVSIVEDACRGINLKPDDTTTALKEMKSAGVTFLQSRDLLAVPKKG